MLATITGGSFSRDFCSSWHKPESHISLNSGILETVALNEAGSLEQAVKSPQDALIWNLSNTSHYELRMCDQDRRGYGWHIPMPDRKGKVKGNTFLVPFTADDSCCCAMGVKEYVFLLQNSIIDLKPTAPLFDKYNKNSYCIAVTTLLTLLNY